MGNSSKRGRDLGAIDEEERQYAIGSHTLEELDEKYVFFFFFFFFSCIITINLFPPNLTCF